MRIRIPSHARRKRSLALVSQLSSPHCRRNVSIFDSSPSGLSAPLVPCLTGKQSPIYNVVSQHTALNMVLGQLRPVGCFLSNSGFNFAPLDRFRGPLNGRGRSLRFFNFEILLLLRIYILAC